MVCVHFMPKWNAQLNIPSKTKRRRGRGNYYGRGPLRRPSSVFGEIRLGMRQCIKKGRETLADPMFTTFWRNYSDNPLKLKDIWVSAPVKWLLRKICGQKYLRQNFGIVDWPSLWPSPSRKDACQQQPARILDWYNTAAATRRSFVVHCGSCYLGVDGRES